jgi:hypothetical protein
MLRIKAWIDKLTQSQRNLGPFLGGLITAANNVVQPIVYDRVDYQMNTVGLS